MLSVFMQRLLGWEPVLVAWVQMLPNLVYGAMVILVGRLADRVPCHVLVMSGLALYAGAFWSYAGINELTTVPLMSVFLILRSTAEAAIGSPNNLATLQALPESKVYMATALTGLLRSIANAMGTATAAVVWDVRYSYRVQQYAETTPLDALGYTTALRGVQQTLQWAGELAAGIPTQTLALMQERLVAEASTAAWQDYFLFNTGLALVGLLPALPFWRRQKYAPAAKPRHDILATSVYLSRPYAVRTNSNSSNCCMEKDLRAGPRNARGRYTTNDSWGFNGINVPCGEAKRVE
jgi:MFS family permease